MRKDSDRLPPLDLLLAFEAAARHLSFTRAGAERFVTQSAISRQIRALEDELGVALFTRRHRALELTPDGQKLLLACSAVLAQLRKTVASIRAPAQREVLALSTTPSFASLWLIPRLLSFTQAHPGVDVRLDASFEVRDLRADGFDLAVRYAPSNSTEGRHLFGETMLPVCAPALLRAKGMSLKAPEDLRRHTVLQMEQGAIGGMPMEWALWLRANALPDLQPRSTLTFSNYNEVIAAAQAGQGVALGRRPLIDALLRQRRLVAPFGDARSTARAYFVLSDPVARTRPAVRALEDWLIAEAART
jgi:LysR family transcriptional regulator, glycine cleavage system transcriptional activator